MLRSLLREPLVHFLLLGGLLFALNAWIAPSQTSPSDDDILVSEGRIQNLAQGFQRTWQRRPTRAELDGLIQDYIREEVLYREAIALGLDQDDTIIRRRLRQKMEFVSDDAAVLATPNDQDLADWLAAHADEFRIEPRATFHQVYLDPRFHDGRLAADARLLLERLNHYGQPDDAASTQGDRLLMLEPRYGDLPQGEIGRVFGVDFARALFEQPVGRWVGPIDSGYGSHLVYVESITPGRVAALEEVRPLLERDWAADKRRQLREAFYAHLLAKYQVSVKLPAVDDEPGDSAQSALRDQPPGLTDGPLNAAPSQEGAPRPETGRP